ncbi:hypothetical protein OAA45_01000 [bacterium]|nr:hypothetical protein [bacterium]
MIKIKQEFEAENLFYLGVLILFGNGAVSHVLGSVGRYGALALGFGLICFSAIVRMRRSPNGNYLMLPIIGSLYCGVLLMNSMIQQQSTVGGSIPIIFSMVIVALFIAGYFMGLSSPVESQRPSGRLAGLFAILAGISTFGYIGFVKAVTFQGGSRDLDTGNPVGIAYIFTVFLMVLLYLILTHRILWVRFACVFAASMAGLVVVTTGSRGAVLSGTLAIIVIGAGGLITRQVKLKLKTVSLGLFFVLVAGALLTYLVQTNYAIGERLDFMVKRFENVYRTLLGQSSDMSTMGRLHRYNSYLQTIDQWILNGEKGYSGYPHNQWLECLVRFGLLGVPLLGLSIYTFIRTSWFTFLSRQVKCLEWYLFALIFFFSYCQSMTSLSLEINRSLWLSMGFLVGYDYRVRRMGQLANEPNRSMAR